MAILNKCLFFIVMVLIFVSINAQDATCTYTFNVPRDGSECLPGSVSPSDASTLQSLMTNQHALIEQQLSDIAAHLEQLTGSNVGGGGSGGQPEGNGEVGSLYTRWGSSSCSDTSEIVYDGYAGKSYYSHGGGVNYLCLPKDPEYPANRQTGHQSGSYVYGVEYEVNGSPVLDPSVHDNDVPCAVCEASGRTRQLMIPAKMTCPSGWTKEYQGILMSQHHTHSSSEYVCVDEGFEVLPGGAAGHDGGLLYVVEAVCTSLKCPPYVDGYELSCAVCTK